MSVTLFRNLHHQEKPLLIGNVWDVQSARIAEKAGFAALGSSSHAMANILGLEDGENLSTEELLFFVQRIVKAVKVPISVDIEAGYSRVPEEINLLIDSLIALGIVGINIEDSVVTEGKRSLTDAIAFASTLAVIRSHLNSQHKDLFINVRTDTYVTGIDDPLAETLKRTTLYQDAGADGIFIPGISTEADIRAAVTHSALPVNTFIKPGMSDFNSQQAWGVKRISSGAGIHERVYAHAEKLFQRLGSQRDFSVFEKE